MIYDLINKVNLVGLFHLYKENQGTQHVFNYFVGPSP